MPGSRFASPGPGAPRFEADEHRLGSEPPARTRCHVAHPSAPVGTTVTASAGDAENWAERGFGVILTHFDEKFRPELEEILTNYIFIEIIMFPQKVLISTHQHFSTTTTTKKTRFVEKFLLC